MENKLQLTTNQNTEKQKQIGINPLNFRKISGLRVDTIGTKFNQQRNSKQTSLNLSSCQIYIPDTATSMEKKIHKYLDEEGIFMLDIKQALNEINDCISPALVLQFQKRQQVLSLKSMDSDCTTSSNDIQNIQDICNENQSYLTQQLPEKSPNNTLPKFMQKRMLFQNHKHSSFTNGFQQEKNISQSENLVKACIINQNKVLPDKHILSIDKQQDIYQQTVFPNKSRFSSSSDFDNSKCEVENNQFNIHNQRYLDSQETSSEYSLINQQQFQMLKKEDFDEIEIKNEPIHLVTENDDQNNKNIINEKFRKSFHGSKKLYQDMTPLTRINGRTSLFAKKHLSAKMNSSQLVRLNLKPKNTDFNSSDIYKNYNQRTNQQQFQNVFDSQTYSSKYNLQQDCQTPISPFQTTSSYLSKISHLNMDQ